MEKGQIEKVIDLLMHQNLMVIDKGTKQYPDYVVGGTADLKRELMNLFSHIMDSKLTDWEKEYINKHLPGKSSSEFYYDNPGAAREDVRWLIDVVSKLTNIDN